MSLEELILKRRGGVQTRARRMAQRAALMGLRLPARKRELVIRCLQRQLQHEVAAHEGDRQGLGEGEGGDGGEAAQQQVHLREV